MSDLIKREDAIRAVAEVLSLNRFASFKNIKDFGRFAERMLSNVPSADRPQGEWIVSCKDSICPICGKDEAEFICGTEDWYGYGLSNYCPNCGARMKGADDETY